MIIVKPNCQYLLEEEDKHVEHVAKCAGICYGNDPFKEPEVPIDYIKVYNNLLKQNHLSPLRHSTYYYIIPTDNLFDNLDFNPSYCNRVYDFDTKQLFVSVNGQYHRDNIDRFTMFYDRYRVSKKEYINRAKELRSNNTIDVFNTLRYTFILTTQISTSRELNRVSPNNICEQSTRYCKFSLPKFGEDVTICQPHWLDMCDEEFGYTNVQILAHDDNYYVKTPEGDTFKLGDEYSIAVKGIPQNDNSNAYYPIEFAEKYIKAAYGACLLYGEAIKAGIAPQDARGLLPLDTATKVVYTYSYKEWQHILDLRLYGTTGKPHPNAKEVMRLLEPILKKEYDKDTSYEND